MTSRKVQAVRHSDGHLALLEPLELPAGPISVTLELPEPTRRGMPSLRGMFPQLSSIPDGDFKATRRIWEHGALEQLESLQRKDP